MSSWFGNMHLAVVESLRAGRFDRAVLEAVHLVGKLIVSMLAETGRIFIFLWEAARAALYPPFRYRLLIQELYFVGNKSTFIIILTGLFTGMVLALQSGKAFRLFNAEGLTGVTTAMSLSRELAPVMAALMVTARAGSAMAAKIGTMRVTQQIDALESMAVNPMSYLVVPRILAGVIMLPILCGLFQLIGILGGYGVAVGLLGINQAVFVEKIRMYMEIDDITHGLVKSACFGLILAWVGCYRGFYTSGGADGVGRSTTSAVVISSVSILVADYFLTALMF